MSHLFFHYCVILPYAVPHFTIFGQENEQNMTFQDWPLYKNKFFNWKREASKGIWMISFVLFSSFVRALWDRYDSPMMQDVLY